MPTHKDQDPLDLWQAYQAQTTPLRRVRKKAVSVPRRTGLIRIKDDGSVPLPVIKAPFVPAVLPELSKKQIRAARRGTIEVDAKIDLHGMTQVKAYNALCAFLFRAHDRGARRLLVVTGYGKDGQSVLRQQLPLWCGADPLRDIILSLTQAAPKQGGSGAFLLVLRRKA